MYRNVHAAALPIFVTRQKLANKVFASFKCLLWQSTVATKSDPFAPAPFAPSRHPSNELEFWVGVGERRSNFVLRRTDLNSNYPLFLFNPNKAKPKASITPLVGSGTPAYQPPPSPAVMLPWNVVV